MRGWRNWQTRTFEGRVGNRTGSSPVLRTIIPKEADYRVAGFFSLFSIIVKGNSKFRERSGALYVNNASTKIENAWSLFL